MRGEYYYLIIFLNKELGSPLLARGVLGYTNDPTAFFRITPACAGSTCFQTQLLLPFWDHPCLRGEYTLTEGGKLQQSGSPLLARGVLKTCIDIIADLGITPACAGSTLSCNSKFIKNRDHPCLRGEYATFIRKN